jgi:hypothetical protein
MRELVAADKRPSVKFFSGLAELDEACDGFRGGELIVISGPTKNGKTLLAQTLTVRFSERGTNSLWVSFEVPIPQFLRQIPERCEFFLPKINRAHNLQWLEDRILEGKLKHETRAVFIDHLHYLIDLANGKSFHLSIDIGMLIRALKQIALRHNVAIFLMAHSTKAQGEGGKPRELTQWDVRDSSMIAQEADSTWIVQRKLNPPRDRGDAPEYSNQAMLKICCHRQTGVMDRRLIIEKRGMLFEEIPSRRPIQVEADLSEPREGEYE